MAGLVFFATENHDELVRFYCDELDCTVWLDQPGCTILQHGHMLLGFCDRDETDECGIVTFYYDDREAVDRMYDRLRGRADGEPVENEEYDIYQFFATDPDGRTLEFQTFLHPIDPPA